MEEEKVSTGPVVETEILQTLLAKAHLQQKDAPNPLDPVSLSLEDEDDSEENPLLTEAEKEAEKPNMVPLFLAGGVVLIALAYGGYKFYKWWACSSLESAEILAEAATEMP